MEAAHRQGRADLLALIVLWQQGTTVSGRLGPGTVLFDAAGFFLIFHCSATELVLPPVKA